MNPFIAIYNFIKEKMLVKYPVLTKCYMYDVEEDSTCKDYYIKYQGNLEFEEIDSIHHNITVDICNFCKENGFLEVFPNIAIIISRGV